MAMWYYWITVYTDWLAMRGRYHCKYARAIPINLMFTDTIACLDDTFNIMPTAEIYLFIVSTTWIISIALTVYLGIRHFRKVRRIKKQKKNNEEL